MSTTFRALALPGLILTAAFIAACSAAPAGGTSPTPASPATPSDAATGGDVSVTIETSGGMCIDGPCGSTVTIASDGKVTQTAPKSADLGTVSDATLAAMLTEIEQADFAAIKSQPFTDTCPIAYDGQKFVYTFKVGSQTQTIDSCEVVVDPANPLFVAVNAAIAEVAPS